MRRQQSLLILIFVLLVSAIAILVQVPLQLGLDLEGGSQLTIEAQPTEEIPVISDRDLEAVLVVVRNRVDGLGVSEPLVQTVGENRISVQLPGVSDPAQAERVLGGTAQLEFREQVNDPEVQAQLQVRQEELLELLQEQERLTGEGREAELAATQEAIAAKEEQIEELTNQLYRSVGLTGKNLEDANVTSTRIDGVWSVVIDFDREGGEKFAQLTRNIAGTGRRLGIFLDDELISAPGVGAEYAETGISGGGARIDGQFSLEDANTLATQLRAGALPVPVEIVENRTVGATLGQDSIRRSIYAGIGGLVLVLGFMVVYYRLPGAIANLSLTIYAILTLACYALLGVTLTLPGIAGFILSIGMAVDANVLIFERTREELRGGKTLYRSVESGFYRAFSSILDSNVTTLIACLALFWFGAGLVKGFAVTLAIGVGVSMFTAITCSRSLMFYVLTLPNLKKPEFFCPNLTPQLAKR